MTKSSLRADAAPAAVKRSPLAGWFGKGSPDSGDDLPDMDIAAGVTRALRLATTGAVERERRSAREPIRKALLAIESALGTIDHIREIIDQAYDVALSAQETEDDAGRALLAESYDDLRLSLETICEGEDGGGPLVGRRRKQIDIQLGGQARYSVSPVRLDSSDKGLALSPPREAFATDEEIARVLEELDRALHKADKAAESYCRDAQFLMARLELFETGPAQRIAS